MIHRLVIPAFLAISAAGHVSAASTHLRCSAPVSSERARLSQYVQKKYKLPATLRLEVLETSLAGSTCHRKLRFKSIDPRRPFEVELYLSPDRRFLARELLDTSIDPIQEERKREYELLAKLTKGNFPSLGLPSAPVTLTLFSDFQCPYCARVASMLKNDILPLERGNVRIVFRHFPLPGHAWAHAAAEGAACAQDQKNEFFWGLHDFIFEHQRELTSENVRRKLTEETKHYSKFDHARFGRCLAGRQTAAKVDEDVEFGTQTGISGTPTVFVNGKRLANVAGPEQIRSVIRELSQTGSKTAAATR